MIVDITYRGELEKNLNVIVGDDDKKEIVYFDYEKGIITFLESDKSERIVDFVETYAGEIKNFEWSKVYGKYELLKIILCYYDLILTNPTTKNKAAICGNLVEMNEVDFMTIIDNNASEFTEQFAIIDENTATILDQTELKTTDNFDVINSKIFTAVNSLMVKSEEEIIQVYNNAIKYKLNSNLNKKRK